LPKRLKELEILLCPEWQTDDASRSKFHEVWNQLTDRHGLHSVIGSLFQDAASGELILGLFVAEPVKPLFPDEQLHRPPK
jgi:hypothetical protein